MKRYFAVLLLLSFTLTSLPVSAKKDEVSLKDRIENAGKIYFIPLVYEPCFATLKVKPPTITSPGTRRNDPQTALGALRSPGGIAMDRSSDYTVETEVADKEVFENFNKKVLKELQARFGEKVSQVSDEFATVKKSYANKQYKVYDYKAMDCDFYIEARLGNAYDKRGVTYTVSGPDYTKRSTLITPGFFYLELTLYEKVKKNKKGKKVIYASSSIIGKHSIVKGEGADLVGTVDDPDHYSDYFRWNKGYGEDRTRAESDFLAFMKKVGTFIPARVDQTYDNFVEALDKKLE